MKFTHTHELSPLAMCCVFFVSLLGIHRQTEPCLGSVILLDTDLNQSLIIFKQAFKLFNIEIQPKCSCIHNFETISSLNYVVLLWL